MGNDILNIWQEVLGDISTPVIFLQLVVIATSLGVAWLLSGAIRTMVMHNAPLHWRVGIGSVKRLTFPLTALLLVWIGRLLLAHRQHVGMLKLACTLLLAMAAIRLMVYFVRYIFSPSGWLKTLESFFVGIIWAILALDLSGFLPDIIDMLESVKFSIGKASVNLFIVMQAICTIVGAILVALWLSRLLENKLARADHVNINSRVVITKIARIFLVITFVLIALNLVGLDLTILSVFGGALGVILGFGLQKIAGNYVSGYIILMDKSMQIGDSITIDKHYGVIENLHSRYLTLGKQDGTSVIIPNEVFMTNAVINHSVLRHKNIKITFIISEKSDLEQVIKVAYDLAQRDVSVLETPITKVQINGMVATGVEFLLSVWCANSADSAHVQSVLYLALWQALQAHNIEVVRPPA